MCGIFGFHSLNNNSSESKKILEKLFILSESRGKEASGIASIVKDQIKIIKSAETASKLLKSKVFQKEIYESFEKNKEVSLIGHSRLVTNGYEDDQRNNQPVLKNGMIVIHNGIIVNHESVWAENQLGERQSDLDSEVIPSLCHKYLKEGFSLSKSLVKVYDAIKGMASIGVLPENGTELHLLTNNGSLYYLQSTDGKAFIFASERFIIHQLIDDLNLSGYNKEDVTNLCSNSILSLSLIDNTYAVASFIEELNFKSDRETKKEIKSFVFSLKKKSLNNSLNYNLEQLPKEINKEINDRITQIKNLKKCTKCILPETFPYISFDLKGVCNYCNDYSVTPLKGIDPFKEDLYKYKLNNINNHDCLVPFSGGRDSSYALHYIKKETDMNPIAFSYDWGMLTDLGRRNQSLMCAELGIEHILVSADIRKKRKNINKNVSAWLKKPSLGTIPLFMAGDKQYFYYNNLLQKQNNLDISIMGENHLEKTGFKVLFSGASIQKDGSMSRHMSNWNKFLMIKFYGMEFLKNPSFLNSSVVDTAKAFVSYYGIPHKFLNIFDYLPWDEKTVDDTIIGLYGWETDPSTSTTWRIGDGTVAFYNYIYYLVAGFTENDTFRSNQIREGVISRERALEQVYQENQPRWETFQWYCNTININWLDALKTINSITPLYKK
jgi:glutamine---fructose-6-phosphate transaminase (isomerizing)